MKKVLSLGIVFVLLISFAIPVSAITKTTSDYEASLYFNGSYFVAEVDTYDGEDHDIEIFYQVMDAEPNIIAEGTITQVGDSLRTVIRKSNPSHAIAKFYIDGKRVAYLGEVAE